MSSQWIPRGFHTVAPNIVADDAEQAVAFFKKAFGATETYRLTMSNGKIAHCELKLGDSVLNIGESMEGWPAHGLLRRSTLKTRTGCSSVRLTLARRRSCR
jgi:PhnB protein